MKKTLFILAVTTALLVSAEEVKKDVPKEVAKVTAQAAPEKPAERALTETESLKIQLDAAKIALLQKKHDIAGFQMEVAPISADQEAVVVAACKSIGIAEADIRTSCGVQTGLDANGQPTNGPDGKPLPAKVWYVRPAPATGTK